MTTSEQDDSTQKRVRLYTALELICKFLEEKLAEEPDYYGSFEFVFQGGKVVHTKETKSHKLAN